MCWTFSVNELTDGSSWKTLAKTVCIYVLLKFMQGGGAGNDLWWFGGGEHFISVEVALKCCLHNLPRFLWLCQQHALFPVDTCAAVHQPCGPSAAFLPPALPLPSLASGPQNWWSAEEHWPRHRFHQQPAQVRGNKMIMDIAKNIYIQTYIYMHTQSLWNFSILPHQDWPWSR